MVNDKEILIEALKKGGVDVIKDNGDYLTVSIPVDLTKLDYQTLINKLNDTISTVPEGLNKMIFRYLMALQYNLINDLINRGVIAK